MGSVKLGACGQFLRIVFFIIQAQFLLMGLALIGLGIYLLVKHQDYDYLTGNEYASGAAVLVAAGAVSVIISGLGIVGAITLSYIFLGLYAIAVAIVVVLEIAAGVVGFVFRHDVEDEVNENALRAISDYRPPGGGSVSNSTHSDYKKDANEAVDFIQNEFDCCGWDDRSNWLNSTYFAETNMFPDSCECSLSDDDDCIKYNVTAGNLTSQDIWTRTCEDRVTDFLREHQLIVGAVGIAFGVVEIVGILLALGLCCAVSRTRGQYTTV